MRFEQIHPTVAGAGGYAETGITTAAQRRAWPDAVTFREVIQHPNSSLGDPDLRVASVSQDSMGMPLAYSGRFAVVFRLTTQQGDHWAFRCFTTPGEDGIGRARAIRYRTIEQYTTKMPDTFVPFRYLMNGVRVGTEWYPAMTMRWAVGKPLGRWIEEHLKDPEALRALCGTLSSLLERLEAAGIAHGDWQHDNLIVSEGGHQVTLVDYDGMYVPEFAHQLCPEMGHPNYQHPARTQEHFGPGLDRFPCLVIETALLALAYRPDLWARYSDGESLLFKHSDLISPEHSPLFQEIRDIAVANQDELLTESLVRLKDACLAGAESTLLPAIAASEAALPIQYNELQPVPDVAPTPQLLNTIGGKKWWAIAEAPPSTRTWWNPSAGGVAVATATQQAPRRSYISPSGTAMNYLSRLESPETHVEEQSHLWRWRAGGALFTTAVTYLMYNWLVFHGFPPFYFLWVLNFATLGYGRWPRQRISQELNAEIEKMENLIRERSNRIAELSGGGDAAATTLSREEYITRKLQAVSISQAYDPSLGIQNSTVRELRKAGINDAQALRQQAHSAELGKLPYEQLLVLQRWCHELEVDAAVEWRKVSGPQPSAPPEVDRLRHEIAEFQRHVTALKQERELFPKSSFGFYLRKLVGIGDPQVGSASAPTGATP